MKKAAARNDIMPIAIKVLDQIKQRLDEFTRRQRVIAEFVLQNPESIAFLSITDLAKKVGVSEATIVRFCNVLGYDGFAHLSREAQQSIQAELEIAGRFQLVRRMRKTSTGTAPESAFERLLKDEIDNLINLSKNIKTEDFFKCVNLMSKADRICIIGFLASSSLATFFANTLSKISPQVDVIHNTDVEASAVLNRLTSKSLVFLISFPRYPKSTADLGQIASKKGATIVAITDSHISPVVPLGDLFFTLPLGLPSFIDAYASPIVFMNALVTELSEQNPEMTKKTLSRYDEYVNEMNLFQPPRVKQNNKKK